MVKDLSVLIVYYHGEEYIEECLSSVSSNLSILELDYEIVVLDNECSSCSEEILNRMKSKFSIKTISLGRNVGFGVGNNLLANHSLGRMLFFLNQDTKVVESTPELRQYVCEPNAEAVFVPLIFNRDMTYQKQIFRYPSLLSLAAEMLFAKDLIGATLGAKRRKNTLDSSWQNQEISLERRYPSGAAFIIDRETYFRSGGFDKRIFLYHEECLLFFNMKSSVLFINFLRCLSVIHYGGTGKPFSSERLAQYWKNLLYVYSSIVGNSKGRRLRVFLFGVMLKTGILLRQICWFIGLKVPYSPSSRGYRSRFTERREEVLKKLKQVKTLLKEREQ